LLYESITDINGNISKMISKNVLAPHWGISAITQHVPKWTINKLKGKISFKTKKGLKLYLTSVCVIQKAFAM